MGSASPVGVRRFAAPQAPTPRSAARDAIQFAQQAPQFVAGSQRVVGNEDCLVVNVYTPTTDGPHPVLVWVHGGGAVTGSPNGYNGALFAQYGIVVVTVGYRLGVLGLLCLPCGGDPTRVTIAGESNGGRTVGTLLATLSARSLFHQAIMQSGTGVGYVVATPDAARHSTAAFLTELGLDLSHAQRLCEIPVEGILEVQAKVVVTSPLAMPFQVVVGGKTVHQRPIDAVAHGAAAAARLLIGTNRDEADLFLPPTAPVAATASPADEGGDVFGSAPGSMVVSAMHLAQARSAYRHLLPAGWKADDIIRQTMTSSEWWIPAMHLAEAQTRAGGTR